MMNNTYQVHDFLKEKELHSHLYASLLKKCYQQYEDTLTNGSGHFILEEVEKILGSELALTADVKQKLSKQLAYDCLVIKRKNYGKTTDTTYPEIYRKLSPNYENQHVFPSANNLFDTYKHINAWSKWNEQWEIITYHDLQFEYLRNLDAKLVLVGKDWCGKVSYRKVLNKLKEQIPKTLTDSQITAYVNKAKDLPLTIQASSGQKSKVFENLLNERNGFTRTLRTNLNLTRQLNLLPKIYRIGNIDSENRVQPGENHNVFLINTFVFLSEQGTASSKVTSRMFKLSAAEFILPLLDIIRPNCVLAMGKDACVHLQTEKRNRGIKLKEMHKEHDHFCSYGKFNLMEKDEFKIRLPNKLDIQYYQVTHPSRPYYFYPNKPDKNTREALIWQCLANML